jgi:hypothetical protein
MKKLNLGNKKNDLHKLGMELFNYLTNLPQSVRVDKDPRTGIQVLLKNVDPTSDDLITFPVYLPSDRAQTFVHEKSFRTQLWGDATSQNSEDEKLRKFRGCITLSIDGEIYHCSVSGLFGSEDVAIAIILMAKATGVSVNDVIINIGARKGKLPEEFCEEGHYLAELLKRYR